MCKSTIFLSIFTSLMFVGILTSNAETIKVGVIAPLSGMRADAGKYMINAISLAQEDLKQKSKLQYELSFVIEDSQYSPAHAVTAFQKLRSFDKIQFFIGPYGSAEVLAVGPIAENSNALIIGPGVQSDEVTDIGDNTFRLMQNFKQEAPVFAEFVARTMKSDKLQILGISAAHSYFKIFKPALESKGRNFGLYEEFEATTADFRSYLIKIKAQNPTDIFLAATPMQAGLLLKQANELGLHAQFYNLGVQSPELVKIAGPAAEGLFYPYSYDGQAPDKHINEFYKRYSDKYGMEPDVVAANSYDTVMLLSSCLEKGEPTLQSVKQCLYDTKNYPGVGGTFSIDKNGDVERPVFIKTIKNGQYVRYQ